MENKKKVRAISIDDAMYAVMQKEAHKSGISSAQLIRLIFADWIKNKKDRKLI